MTRGGSLLAKCCVSLSLLTFFAVACDRDDNHLPNLAGGDPDRGASVVQKYGCKTCHVIPGIRGADGLVGPPLTGIAQRMYIGGVARNTPENMIEWIEDPKKFDSKTAMPNVGVTHRDAVDIASYLYTLK